MLYGNIRKYAACFASRLRHICKEGKTGIGEKRRKALLTTFKTIDKIKEATLDELLNVKEMDSKSAQSVYDYFRRNSDV